VLVRIQLPHREVRDLDVEYRLVGRDRDVMVDHIREPHEIVRKARPHASSRQRVPPVLHIAFDKLPRRCSHDVLPCHSRIGVDESHYVLQLIAKSEGTARLVQRGPCPHSAGEGLV